MLGLEGGAGWPQTQGASPIWDSARGEGVGEERRWAQRGAHALAFSGKPCSEPTECPSVPRAREQAVHSHTHIPTHHTVTDVQTRQDTETVTNSQSLPF